MWKMPDSLNELVEKQHAESRPVRSIELHSSFDSHDDIVKYELTFNAGELFVRRHDGRTCDTYLIDYPDFERLIQEYRNFQKLTKFANGDGIAEEKD
jgi:hypothetical protein